LPQFGDFDPSQEGPQLPPDVPDRGTWIAVSAIAQIILGLLVLLMVPLGIAGQLLGARMTGESFSTAKLAGLLIGSLLYLLVGAVMIACGIGAVRRRRWARAVALVYSTIWLLVGLVGLVWLGLIMPALLKVLPAQGGTQLPAAARMAIVVVSLAVGAVFYVALPAVIVFFYSRPSVRANFDCFDPGPAWTDACPLPVLGFSAFMFLAALGTLGTAVTGTAFCFGQVVGGLPAVALTLASSGLAGVLAWGLFRMRPAAWWGTLGWVLFWFSSWISSVALLTAEEFYAAMGSGETERQAAQMLAGNWGALPWLIAATGAAVVGYLLWLRRYFAVRTDAGRRAV